MKWRKILTVGVITAVIAGFGLWFNAPAHANVIDDACSNSDMSGAAGCDVKNPDGDDTKLTSSVSVIVNTLLYIVGILAVVMIIIGAIMFITSAGDPGRTKTARYILIYSVVGLIVALLSFTIVNWVVPKFAGDGSGGSGGSGSSGQTKPPASDFTGDRKGCLENKYTYDESSGICS
jgi:hypothetical protein